jgi:hypothetical protein
MWRWSGSRTRAPLTSRARVPVRRSASG